MLEFADIKAIRDFKSLIKYLRTHLDWPVDEDQVENLSFEYSAEELGLDKQAAVKIREIKQLRPLTGDQPWGIFWINFEPKRLPVVVMRRVLAALVLKKRGGSDDRKAVWNLRDLMFISATGEGQERGISFAHFQDMPDGLPQLRTFSWDANENHFYYLEKVNLECLRWPTNSKDVKAWRDKWSCAFTAAHREVITSSEILAGRMAQLASATRSLVNDIFLVEQPEGPLHSLYASFKRVLIHDLSVDDFADMYAQTVTYGLFSAYATNPHSLELSLEKIDQLIPPTNPFLRELFAECVRVGTADAAEMDLDELGVGELLTLLSQANMEAILQDFGRQTRGEDPVIHFYESFLKEYDAQKKAQRGVFYTPDPVVSFIVRSVDYLLKTEFGYPDGLADTGTMDWKGQQVPRVQVLDPATGTGTFLKYVIEQVYDNFQEKHKRIAKLELDRRWNEYVPKHLLPRLYGFELMMAPYAVAHLKLGLALQAKGYKFSSQERLRVYLTNTLQSVNEIPRTDSPLLANEASEANVVKNDTPITVVVGNPPYSYASKNNGEWISHLVRDYYQVDGVPINEKNPKGLQDDYVKFFRFGQWRIDSTGEGILAMITNNGYLDNPTFRGMRWVLSQSFSTIYVLNLHGNSNVGEVIPENGIDENVFDIQQGVSICLMVRKSSEPSSKKVLYADLYGSRLAKYEKLLLSSVKNFEWLHILQSSPNYYFTPTDINAKEEYEKGWNINDIMPVTTVGIYSARDDLAISWNKKEFESRLREFISLRPEIARSRFSLGDDSEDWKIELAQNDVISNIGNVEVFQKISYRPFDTRFTFYSGRSRGFICRPRPEVMKHAINPKNISLCFVRRTREQITSNFLVVRDIVDKTILTSADNANISPLYLFNIPSKDPLQKSFFDADNQALRQPNFSKKFISLLENKLGLRFILDPKGDLTVTFGPEDLLGYIYAIFYSPAYRKRYSELIKKDYPRVPITSNLKLFCLLVEKGAKLISIHLMDSLDFVNKTTTFVGWAENSVSAGFPKYNNGKVSINPQQSFEGITEEVWNFRIGGYQVCEKWLKDRRGRQLSEEDIAHYQKIIVAIQETIRRMGEIDEVIEEHGGWPIQ